MNQAILLPLILFLHAFLGAAIGYKLNDILKRGSD